MGGVKCVDVISGSETQDITATLRGTHAIFFKLTFYKWIIFIVQLKSFYGTWPSVPLSSIWAWWIFRLLKGSIGDLNIMPVSPGIPNTRYMHVWPPDWNCGSINSGEWGYKRWVRYTIKHVSWSTSALFWRIWEQGELYMDIFW